MEGAQQLLSELSSPYYMLQSHTLALRASYLIEDFQIYNICALAIMREFDAKNGHKRCLIQSELNSDKSLEIHDDPVESLITACITLKLQCIGAINFKHVNYIWFKFLK